MSNDSTTEAHNIQAVIDTLSLDLLGLSLSHITGEDVVSGNAVCTYHLLEVFESLFLHLSAKTEDDTETSGKYFNVLNKLSAYYKSSKIFK